MPQPPFLLTAGLLHPVAQSPIVGGFLRIEADGRIGAVGSQSGLPEDCWGLPVVDFPDAIVTPGLVNLHTHLEYTQLSPGRGPLHSWMVALVRQSRRWTDEQRLASALAGVQTSLAAGVTCVADTSPTGASLEAAARLGLRGVFFQEAFGLDDGEAALVRITDRLDRLMAYGDGTRRLGVSPHAPYTVSLALWAKLNALAAARGLPLSTHLVESAAEVAWFRREPSDVDSFHAALGIEARRPPIGHPVTVLDEAGLLVPSLLAAHCVHAGPMERLRLRERGVIAVHCPRSNAGLAVGEAPLADWEAEGLRWGLGTDSVASSGGLDLRGELRMATAKALTHPPARWLARLTLEAAQHLGLAHEIGSLTPGKWADLALWGGGGRFSRGETPAGEWPWLVGPCTLVAGRVVTNSRLPDE